MDEKEKIILEFMNDSNYIPMKAKEMANLLNVPKNEYEDFRTVLKKLVEENKIEINRKSKYKIIDTSKYIMGTFRANQKGFGFVTIENSNEEIFVAEKNKKNAMNGDKVLVELQERVEENLHKEGKIIKILKHEKDTVVGLFKKSRNYAFVIPDDKNLGTDIYISKKNFGKAKDNCKVIVEINKNAEGKVIEVIGNINEAGVDMLSLIKEYRLPYEFPQDVINEATKIKQTIDENEIKNRLDLRKKEIFTIDGEDAKDLDDAVCVEQTNNNT